MVANEERAAFLGDIIAAQHFDAIDGVRGDPHDQTQQCIWQQPERVDRADNGEKSADQENAARAEVQKYGQQIVDARGQERADEGEKICRGEQFAFAGLFGAML